MKKHLIAAAVAAAVAVPAMAQVTVSGRIDTSVINSKNANGKTISQVPSAGLITTPQLVLSGSEDLGGGLKAKFNVATPINTDSATSLSLGNRGFTVGVEGGFGSLELGKSPGTSILGIVTAGYIGNLTGMPGVIDGRPNNAVIYSTPSISGFRATVQYGMGTEVAANKDQTTDMGISYSAGPLAIRVGQSATKDYAGAAVSASTDFFGTPVAAVTAAAAGVAGTTSRVSLADSRVTQTSFDASYNFGVAAVRYGYQKQDFVTNVAASNNTALQIGVRVPLGKAVSVAVEHMSFDSKTANTDQKVTAGAVFYDLSKRTNVYAAVAGRTSESASIGGETLFGAGVRHSF